MQMTKIILRIGGLYGKSSDCANEIVDIDFWMRDQFDHSVFALSDLTAEHVSKADEAWDYLLKFRN
jgi:hypothetical protein